MTCERCKGKWIVDRPHYVMSFEPDAIRDHLINVYELEEKYLKIMDSLSEEDWLKIGEMAIDSDHIWETFNDCVDGAFLYYLKEAGR